MTIYRILFATVFIVNFAIVARYRRLAQRGERFDWKKEGAWIALPLRAAGLCGLLYLILYIAWPAVIKWSLVEVPEALRWAGFAVGILVMPPFVWWAQSNLGNNVSPTVVTREHHELVTTGPYRYIRHPLYTAGIMLYGCLAAISGSWFILALSAVGVAFILIRLPKEEAELAARFGNAYQDYRAQTGGLIPRIR